MQGGLYGNSGTEDLKPNPDKPEKIATKTQRHK